MLVGSEILRGYENISQGSFVQLNSDRGPKKISECARRWDFQPLNLFNRKPVIIVLKQNLQKWSKQIIAVAKVVEGIAIALPRDRMPQASAFFQQSFQFIELLFPQLGNRVDL